ncbi:ankyrin repeat domain-containing protein [Pinibacter soli]|uniref:Ankyrin repeat domain-containing protein n=1 Tax=Pinibacter soli TaxID=3044211 RepID=A0ABT6RD25_9BACT|nr:ankyrin repeat domain-containing protein [Pinibacter soli]MDI3320440.1 ankyrin repeat domain-containing protein [Pinibacter soli]
MAKKRATLPRDFDQLVEACDLDELKRVFDKCDLNAVAGYTRSTALGFFNIPEELVRWLVSEGADIEARDTYGLTPLHQQASMRTGNIDILIELGANIAAIDNNGCSPLHRAAANAFSPSTVQMLLQKGANVLAIDRQGATPLLLALKQTQNADIENVATISQMLLEAGTPVTEEMQKAVASIGEGFEFYMDKFNKDYLEATEAGLAKLYQLFKVEPVKRRITHDGISLIQVTTNNWKDQHNELWELLVPASGPAKTIQGEVIRITGRVSHEILNNGGGNWDSNYKKMLSALTTYVSLGIPLEDSNMNEIRLLSTEVSKGYYCDEEKLSRLHELAVTWVRANPNPILLEKPGYNR